jgi:UDP-2-acetamido-2,6-beta-L-arabino-hexul-4-ose reductase
MKILVTGANGFVGKNLLSELKNQGYEDLFLYDICNTIDELEYFTKECDFVFHLAGVNRPKTKDEFMKGNFGFTSILLELLKKHNNKAPVLITSSIQALLDNSYGQSKKAGEDCIFAHSKEMGSKAFVYRLPNIFGKWCNPNYNSAIATFCYNTTRDLPIQVNDPSVIMNLVYIDDVVQELINALNAKETRVGNFCEVKTVYTATLGEIVNMIKGFKELRDTLEVPNLKNELEKKLYSTYLSYLPKDQFKYPLKMNCDTRGSFTEIIRTQDRGQFSVNIAKPAITKGNHWHHTKNEKFLVVSGEAKVQFRKIYEDEIIEYTVSGKKLEVIDIPVGYTHNIINVGTEDLITFMWCNEVFNPEKPDTFFLEV